MDVERRSMVAELRLSEGSGTKPAMLSGHAAVFDSLSSEVGPPSKRFRERIMPGAFRATLASGDEVLAYYNHGLAGGMPHAAMPLGGTRDGSLRLREDARGLAFELDVPQTSQGRDLVALASRGTVRGVSFAFRGAKDTWHRDGAGLVRTVHEIRGLADVSPTHMPAYAETTLAVRSLEVWERENGESAAARETASRRRRLRLAEIT